MQLQDVSDRYYNTMLDILFSVIKNRINWNYIQSIINDKIFLYSDKKRCQVLLALVDGLTDLGHKFNYGYDEQVNLLHKYMTGFKFYKSFEYMKSYRKHFLVDVFGMFVDYDNMLKTHKLTPDQALSTVNIMSMETITEMTNRIEKDTKQFLGNIDSYEDMEDYKTQAIMTEMLCKQVVGLAETLQCNYKRANTNLVALLFDAQSLYLAAFSSDFAEFQVEYKDEWKLLELKKLFAETMDEMLKSLSNITKFEYVTNYGLSPETMQRVVMNTIHLPYDDENITIDVTLLYEEPIMLHMKA